MLPRSCVNTRLKRPARRLTLPATVSGSSLTAILILVSGYYVTGAAAGFGWAHEDYPADERTARIEMDEGFFDSTVWERVQPFYEQPLCVPLGELRYLRDIFPDLPDDLPVQAKILSRYEPWTKDNITVFFRDFPCLQPLKALLSFEKNRVSSFANIAFLSRLSGFGQKMYQSVRFSVKPVKPIRAEGTVFFEDTYARWRRRRFVIEIPRIGTLQAGNFSFTMNRGLFYGYFPGFSSAADTVKYNWLCGASRTWNGFASATPFGRRNKLQVLLHTRETESVVGLKAVIRPTRVFSLYGALSGASIETDDDSPDTTLSIHGGVQAKLGPFALDLESGAQLLEAPAVPLAVSLSHRLEKQTHTFSYVRIPGHFFAPRSSLVHSFYSRLGVNDSATGDITCAVLTISGDWLRFCRQYISLSYITEGSRADCRASCKLSGYTPCVYSLRYSFNVNNITDRIKHRVNLSGEYDITSMVSLAATCSYNLDVNNYWRVTAHIRPGVKLFSSLLLAPFITYFTNSNSQRDIALGVNERIDLFEKSFSEITMTVPVVSSNNEGCSLYAKAHFLF